VIVGAGSAGCVLAARLTEDPKTRVLLLEAGGGADKFLIRMPLGMMKAMAQARADLADDDRARADAERPPAVPAARAAARRVEFDQRDGLHARAFGRYDRWAQKGARGWSHAEVLPYFRRMERSWRGTGNYGSDGPLPITKNNTATCCTTS
jgi:choline dehydrogenase